MKTTVLIATLILTWLISFGRTVTFNVKNNFSVPIQVKVLKGGKLDNVPLSTDQLGQVTISAGETELILIKVQSKDIISVLAELPSGSKFLVWSGQITGRKKFEVQVDKSKFEIRIKPVEYLENLQNDLYKDQDIEHITERTNSDASIIFKSHLGGLAIVVIASKNGKEFVGEGH